MRTDVAVVSMSSHIDFIPLYSTSEHIEKACTLYELAFPECERRPTEAWLRLMDDEPAFHAMLIGTESIFAGILTYWEMPGFVYVEHFAVVPEARGGGIGQHMMQQFRQAFPRVVLEAEPPTDELTHRRIAFYRRCGFEMSERPYFQPPYRWGEQSVPLVLMSTDAVWLEKHHEEVSRVLAERVYGVKRLDACCKSE